MSVWERIHRDDLTDRLARAMHEAPAVEPDELKDLAIIRTAYTGRLKALVEEYRQSSTSAEERERLDREIHAAVDMLNAKAASVAAYDLDAILRRILDEGASDG